MSDWPGGQLHREDDNANYTCTSTSNIAGPGATSQTHFVVECKYKFSKFILVFNTRKALNVILTSVTFSFCFFFVFSNK